MNPQFFSTSMEMFTICPYLERVRMVVMRMLMSELIMVMKAIMMKVVTSYWRKAVRSISSVMPYP